MLCPTCQSTYVLISNPRSCKIEVGENTKGFCLGWGALERKPRNAKWKNVFLNKGKGDLGVRSLSTLDKVLLQSFVNGIGDMQLKMTPSRRPSSTANMGMKKVDKWCGEEPFCEAFPLLYAVADSKGKRMAEVWEALGEEGGWNPCFLRPFNDWELKVVNGSISRFSTIQNKRISLHVKDKLVWKMTKNGLFSVKPHVLLVWLTYFLVWFLGLFSFLGFFAHP